MLLAYRSARFITQSRMCRPTRRFGSIFFGAKPVMVGKTEMLKIPGAFIVLSQGQPTAGNPLVNHLGIWGKDLDSTRAKLTAAGIQTAPKAQFIDLPNSVRLEFIDDPNGPDAPSAHHIHYFVGSQQDG